jgi:hypothetical protein
MRRGGKLLLSVLALLSLTAGVRADDSATGATAESVGPPSTIDEENMTFDKA